MRDVYNDACIVCANVPYYRSRRDEDKQRLDYSQHTQFHPSESMIVHYAESSRDVGDGSHNATSPHSYNGIHPQHTPTHEHLGHSTFGINYRVYHDHQHDLQGMGAQFSTSISDNPHLFAQDQHVSYIEQAAVLYPNNHPTGHEQTTPSNDDAGTTSAQNDVVVSCGSEGSHFSLTEGCWCGELAVAAGGRAKPTQAQPEY
jgi:hypothetical protein